MRCIAIVPDRLSSGSQLGGLRKGLIGLLALPQAKEQHG